MAGAEVDGQDPFQICGRLCQTIKTPTLAHSDYRTVSPYWVLPVYVELIRAVWADYGDRPLLF
jgi:hypothetical protein